ncbi:hypothetical protein BDV11DRAFT_60050 [Aspergillus similis]
MSGRWYGVWFIRRPTIDSGMFLVFAILVPLVFSLSNTAKEFLSRGRLLSTIDPDPHVCSGFVCLKLRPFPTTCSFPSKTMYVGLYVLVRYGYLQPRRVAVVSAFCVRYKPMFVYLYCYGPMSFSRIHTFMSGSATSPTEMQLAFCLLCSDTHPGLLEVRDVCVSFYSPVVCTVPSGLG